MQLDVRTPIGFLFLTIGLILVALGLFSDPAMNAKSLGINIDLWWGLVMASFGGSMLVLVGRRKKS